MFYSDLKYLQKERVQLSLSSIASLVWFKGYGDLF